MARPLVLHRLAYFQDDVVTLSVVRVNRVNGPPFLVSRCDRLRLVLKVSLTMRVVKVAVPVPAPSGAPTQRFGRGLRLRRWRWPRSLTTDEVQVGFVGHRFALRMRVAAVTWLVPFRNAAAHPLIPAVLYARISGAYVPASA